jgi:hypothetical protein
MTVSYILQQMNCALIALTPVTVNRQVEHGYPGHMKEGIMQYHWSSIALKATQIHPNAHLGNS